MANSIDISTQVNFCDRKMNADTTPNEIRAYLKCKQLKTVQNKTVRVVNSRVVNSRDRVRVNSKQNSKSRVGRG